MISFAALRQANIERRNQQAGEHAFSHRWTPIEWALAFIGEAGEVCNAVKKWNRRPNDTDPEVKQKVANIGKELADTIVYADLLAEELGIDLGAAVLHKFNEVSTRVGSNVFLTPGGGVALHINVDRMWMRCPQMLPTHSDPVLVAWRNTAKGDHVIDVRIGHFFTALREWRIDFSNSDMTDRVVAWMELPKPPVTI